jgi:hypothetical protein
VTSDFTVPVYRSGAIVSSLSNSFSASLKETRLTAFLAYMISLNPSRFLNVVGYKAVVEEVHVEYQEDAGRSDIRILTNRGDVVVEAKTTNVDPKEQALRYAGRFHVLITNFSSPVGQQEDRVRYLSWSDIYIYLSDFRRSNDYREKFVSNDLVKYLEEHRMVRKAGVVEVYARDIIEEATLNLFLHSRLYSCAYEAGSRITEAGYFAPHFGERIANHHPGISIGISYVAKIEEVDLADSRKGFFEILRKHRGKAWVQKNSDLLQQTVRYWKWDGITRHFLFLAEPRLVFNPSVKKELLQKGKGWLSKRYLSFDELFQAWSGKPVYQQKPEINSHGCSKT